MGWLDGIVDFATSIIPGPIDDAIVNAGRQILRGKPERGPVGFNPTGRCSPGFVWNGMSCQPVSFSGGPPGPIPIPQIPGRGPGKAPGDPIPKNGEVVIQGDPISELVGVAGRSPTLTTRRTCGPGFRLAANGLCYPKAALAAKYYAYRSKKAPVSWRDMHLAKKAKSVAGAIDRAEESLRRAGFKAHASRTSGK